MRRAWWSLMILLALYAMSLVSELLCNNTPLYVRHNGQSFFPVFRFYPEDVFLGNGKQTRPDYKSLAAARAFAPGSGNIIVFPPIAFGPFEILDPASVAAGHAAEIRFTPRARIATIAVRPDLTVLKTVDATPFLGIPDEDLTGKPFTNALVLPAPISEGIARRFRNEAAETVEAGVGGNTGIPRYIVSLAAYQPRPAPPSSVRLTLREALPDDATGGSVAFDSDGRVTRVEFPLWRRLTSEDLARMTERAHARLSAPVDKQTVIINGGCFEAVFEKTDVHWPHPPVAGHWMGIDSAGRDVMTRVLYGLRTALSFGFLLVAVSMIVGIAMGAAQGYFGGTTDITVQRVTEIWSALPFLYIMILLGSVYGRGFLLLLVCYALFNWIGISYYVRGEFLRLRHQPFVEAARVTGLPHRRIVFRHILPNALVPIITFFPFYLMGAIGVLAALDFLGFGLPPPTPSWGELLQQAHQFRWAWWLILYPSLALFGVMLLCVFIGEGVRDAYDPRPVSRME